MFKSVFAKYQRVYGYAWRTYGQSNPYRLSLVLQIVKNGLKYVVLPILLTYMLVAISGKQFDEAMRHAIFFGLGSALIGITAPFVKYVGMIGENKVYKRETTEYFGRLLESDIDYFNSNLSGYLTTATRQYVDSGVQFVRAFRDAYSQTVMAFIFPVIVIALTNWMLGLIVFGLSILQLGYLIWSSYALEPYRARSRELYRQHSGVMADAILNILAVKAAAQEGHMKTVVGENAGHEAYAFKKRYTVRAKLTVGREAVTVTAYVVFLLAIIMMAKSGSLSLAGAILVATYVSPILTAIYMLAEQLDEHDDFIDKLLPGLELIEQERRVCDPAKPKPFENVRGAVSFKQVSFSYEEHAVQSEVFHDFSLEIPVGQKVGVVGASGVGKSTLTKLLLRFSDVDSGAITVDGIDIRDVRQTDLRRHIAYVPQEPLLFHLSIRDNILFSRPDASDDELFAAVSSAHVKQLMKELPDGLDSIVGERGVKLSGGQKQRVAIARAVLQNAPIMVLDEATSALDSESEAIIKSSFKDILKDKTAIVVAHRLSTLSEMDRIVVMKDGRIVEDGTHDELLKLQGEYAKLWEYQQRLERDTL